VVYDLAVSDRVPHAVLTGDTLFIGDVGRPDLMASVGVSAETLAEILYDSVHGKLLQLPDSTVLYPGHGAGSLCGKNLSVERISTIGAQRRDNPALQPMSKRAFVDLVTADQPPAPAYFGYDARLNRRERATLDETLARELQPLTLDEVLKAQAHGAQLLDTRDPADFAAGHLPGSLSVGLAGRFASWAGTLLTTERPIVIVANSGFEATAATRLGRVGLDNVLGYLDGGIDAARAGGALVGRPVRITSDELRGRLGTLPIIDVRAEAEWAIGVIPGSINIPLEQLRARLDEIPAAGPVVVYCRTGERSSTAASLLEQAGWTEVLDLVGGIAAWMASAPKGVPVHV
jgi:rhodanese-related sulfurtransferase